jgi:hypothetical protein
MCLFILVVHGDGGRNSSVGWELYIQWGGKNKVVLANYVLHYAIAGKQCDNKLVIRTYADLPPNHAFAKQREKKE